MTETRELDSKYMAVMLTKEGFMRWAEGKSLQITDVKPEFREILTHNFIGHRPEGGIADDRESGMPLL